MINSITEIIFLLDRSGSMGGLERDTIGGFNAFINQQSKLEGVTNLTAVLFDDQYEILWNGVPADSVQLTENEYYVRGATALLDAIGRTILNVEHRLNHLTEVQRPEKVIFVVTTDGMENSSREFTYRKIKDLIMRKQEKDNWEFLFLGANIDAYSEADSLGIGRNNAFSFEASTAGVEKMYQMVNDTVMAKRDIN